MATLRFFFCLHFRELFKVETAPAHTKLIKYMLSYGIRRTIKPRWIVGHNFSNGGFALTVIFAHGHLVNSDSNDYASTNICASPFSRTRIKFKTNMEIFFLHQLSSISK